MNSKNPSDKPKVNYKFHRFKVISRNDIARLNIFEQFCLNLGSRWLLVTPLDFKDYVKPL